MSGWFASMLVGLSVAATLFSGISFLAYPAVIYNGGIVLFVGTVLVCMPAAYLVLTWFLPRYLRKGTVHPYDGIEKRFGGPSRTTASVLYVLMRIGWMADRLGGGIITCCCAVDRARRGGGDTASVTAVEKTRSSYRY